MARGHAWSGRNESTARGFLRAEKAFARNVGEERQIKKSGKWVVPGKDGRLYWATDGPQVFAQGKPASQDFLDDHPKVGDQVHPAFSFSSPQRGNGFALDKQPKEVGEIDARTGGECVPAPNARINIENAELTIPGISFELYFCKASKPHRT